MRWQVKSAPPEAEVGQDRASSSALRSGRSGAQSLNESRSGGYSASYAGLVPRIHSSGGRILHGGTCRNVNQYLKWGFVEAATCSLRIKAYRGTHVERLYPWTVIQVEDRAAYLAALDRASIEMNIEPFAKFISNAVARSTEDTEEKRQRTEL